MEIQLAMYTIEHCIIQGGSFHSWRKFLRTLFVVAIAASSSNECLIVT